MTLYLSKNWTLWRAFSYEYFQNSFFTSASILSNHNILCCCVGICIYIKDWLKEKWEGSCYVRTVERKMEARTVRQLATNEERELKWKSSEERKKVDWADDQSQRVMFSKQICCNLLVYRHSCVIPLISPHPYFENYYFFTNAQRNSKSKKRRKIEELKKGRKIIQWIEMKRRIELKTLMYKSIDK